MIQNSNSECKCAMNRLWRFALSLCTIYLLRCAALCTLYGSQSLSYGYVDHGKKKSRVVNNTALNMQPYGCKAPRLHFVYCGAPCVCVCARICTSSTVYASNHSGSSWFYQWYCSLSKLWPKIHDSNNDSIKVHLHDPHVWNAFNEPISNLIR